MSFDREKLSLRILVDPRAMAPIDLSGKRKAQKVAGEVTLRPENFSATLGLDLDLDPCFSEDESGQEFSLSGELELEPKIYLFGFVAAGDFDLDYDDSLNLSAEEAAVIRDFPSIGGRLKTGIVDTRPVSFQTSSELVGLSFYRDSSLPGGRGDGRSILEELVLEHSASVSIEMNGTIVRNYRLDPGSYELSDLPFSSGLNDVLIRIEEEGKEPRLLRSGFPFDSSILKAGEIDYALTLGMDKDTMSRPLAEAFFSAGIGRSLELGVDGELGYGAAMGGLSSIWASPFGNLSLSGALSLPYSGGSAEGPSFSSQLSWRLSFPGRPGFPLLGLAVAYRGAEFAPPTEDSSSDPALHVPSWRFSGQISETLSKAGTSLGLFCDSALRSGSLYTLSLSTGFSIPAASSSSISLTLGADWSKEEGFVPEATIAFSASAAKNGNLHYSHDLVSGSDDLSISQLSETDRHDSLSFFGEGLVGAADHRDLSLSYQARTRLFDFSATGSYYETLASGATSWEGHVLCLDRLRLRRRAPDGGQRLRRRLRHTRPRPLPRAGQGGYPPLERLHRHERAGRARLRRGPPAI